MIETRRSEMAEKNIGKITQVISAVLDIKFPQGGLPEINDAIEITTKDGGILTVEVAQHLGDDPVRCIALGPTDGLVRGMDAVATGGPIMVPVGEQTLGRIFNVLGQPIDNKEAPKTEKKLPIHRKAPSFEEQSTETEILETGIKVVDLLCPYQKGGKIGLFGGTGSHRYEVTFRGPGGHSFGAFGLVNPIFAMGRAISYISELRTPREPKTTFSVGVVNGGTSINAIAYECSMLVDIRSNGLKELEELDAKLQECIKRAVEDENNRWETERSYEESKDSFDHNGRITVEVKQIGNRPAGSQPKDCEIVNATASAFQACGEDVEFESAGSTDANIPISLGIPAICVGGGGKGGACHSVDEWYDSKDAYKGSQRVLAAIFALVGLDGVSEPLLSRRKK